MQCLLHCFNCSWAKEANFLFNRNKPLFVINDYSATYVDTDRSSHLSYKCNLSTCRQRFHHQMQCSCLLHSENYSWPKDTDFLFNRNKPLFVINDYSATYVGTDRSSRLSCKCNLSMCSQRFHHQMQCSCLLHSENYSWPKDMDFLFNRNKPLFVINDYSATYLGMERSSHLSRKCNLYTYSCSLQELHMCHHRHSWNNSQCGRH
jgi:hypothetical protein